MKQKTVVRIVCIVLAIILAVSVFAVAIPMIVANAAAKPVKGGNGYISAETKLHNEGRKILHLPEMNVTCTCVRVPVFRSHSISVTVRTERKISVEEARAAIAQAPGCRLVDDLNAKIYPMPLDTSDQDIVFVGRIRDDLTCENGLSLWCCGDQIRKGAATNAIQIAELLLK